MTATAETIAREPDYARTLLESFKSPTRAPFAGRAIRPDGRQALIEAVEEMHVDGELEAWVDPRLLATRIGSIQRGLVDENGG